RVQQVEPEREVSDCCTGAIRGRPFFLGPLVSRAKVLFTPDGENILSAAETRSEQPFRQSAYLSLAGMDVDTLTSVSRHDDPRFRFDPLLQQGDRGYQRSQLAADRERARSFVKERLGPQLAMLT